MKLLFKFIALYLILFGIIITAFYSGFILGFATLFFWILISRTYFQKTFIPYCVGWFGKVLSEDKLMLRLKNGDLPEKYIGFLGSLYIGYHNKDSEIQHIIYKISTFAFIFLPIMIIAHHSLYTLMNKLND